MPKLSVCIPTYNAEKYLSETLDSLLAQDFADCEVIILDNISTDRTDEIIRSYLPRFRVPISYRRNETNLGTYGNCNRGAHLATGDYLTFLHSDDVLDPGSLTRRVAALDAHPEVGLVVPTVRHIDGSGRQTRYIEQPETKEQGLAYLLKDPGANPFCFPLLMIRREVLNKTGFFDPLFRYAADLHLWTRIALNSHLYFQKECAGSYRVHAQSGYNTFTAARRLGEVCAIWNLVLDHEELIKDGGHATAEMESQLARRFFRERVIGILLNGDTQGAIQAAGVLDRWRGKNRHFQAALLEMLPLLVQLVQRAEQAEKQLQPK